MYDYYKGYVIREGTDGIKGARLRALYEMAGWCDSSLPDWQNEKFEIAMKIMRLCNMMVSECRKRIGIKVYEKTYFT